MVSFCFAVWNIFFHLFWCKLLQWRKKGVTVGPQVMTPHSLPDPTPVRGLQKMERRRARRTKKLENREDCLKEFSSKITVCLWKNKSPFNKKQVKPKKAEWVDPQTDEWCEFKPCQQVTGTSVEVVSCLLRIGISSVGVGVNTTTADAQCLCWSL